MSLFETCWSLSIKQLAWCLFKHSRLCGFHAGCKGGVNVKGALLHTLWSSVVIKCNDRFKHISYMQTIYHISHKTKATCFIMCRFPFFFFFAKTAMMHQGRDTRLILWCLALGNWLMILHGSDLFLNIPQMLVRMGSVEFRDQITTLGSLPCS